MANYRRGRINDEMQKELALIVREIKDPRVSGSMVCITGAEVSGDLKNATVYYSVLGGDKKEVGKGLKAASGFIRKRIAETMNLRMTPEFKFVMDESIEHGARIAAILNTIEFKDEEPDGEEEAQHEES